MAAASQIQSLPLSLVDEAAQLSLAGFRDNGTCRIVFPNSDSPVSVAHEARRIREEITGNTMNPSPTKWHLCITNPSGELACYAHYYIHADDPAPEAQQPDSQIVSYAGRTAPPDANQEAWDFVVPRTAAARAAAMGDDRTYLYLATLCTAASARRRGFGTMMLVWGKEKAREFRLPLMLQASPEAVSVYAKGGLRVIGEARKDLSRWNGGEVVDFIMRWDAEQV